MYRAVFFDAGETLIHPQPSFPELFAHIMRDAGYAVEPAAIESAVTGVSRRFEEAARNDERWSTSPERSRAFWFSIYASFLEGLGIPDSQDLRQRLYATFSDPASYGLFDDVAPAVERLHAAGYRMGVISNFEAWLDRLLDQLGMQPYMPVRAISGVEGVEKPDLRLFRIALERAGLDPSACVYVGDNPAFDMEPAAELGMFPVLIDRNDRHGGSRHTRIASLAELPEVIPA